MTNRLRCFGRWNNIIVLLLLLFVWPMVYGGDADGNKKRRVNATLNPECGTICDDTMVTVIHITSTSATDEIHYLWDFTGIPAALILHFNGTGIAMHMDWQAFMDGAPNCVTFSKEPQFYFGVALQHLWQFNDRNDTGTFDPATSNDVTQYSLQDFKWNRTRFAVDEDAVHVSVLANTRVSSHDNASTDMPIGNFKLELSSFGMPGHDVAVPHLPHSENATQFDVILEDLVVDTNYTCSRFALGLTLVSMEPRASGNFSLALRKSLDDEFTPGIFEVVNVESPMTELRKSGGYLQYRPVSYRNVDREVTASTHVTQTGPTAVVDALDTLHSTIFYAVAGFELDRALVQSMNVSFGASGDGCYPKTNYTTWTFVSGYGAPLPEQLSMFMAIVATIGIGVPLLLMISCGCYLFVKKARSNQSSQ